MKKFLFIFSVVLIFSAFSTTNDRATEFDGIWIHEQSSDKNSKSYLIIEGSKIQLYLEAYWKGGYHQYFQGKQIIANGSLIIHVDHYLTVSSNTQNIIKYKNCPEYNLQRLVIHNSSIETLELEIVPGTSIYNSFGFFEDQKMTFKKCSSKTFQSIDPIFSRIPEILTSKSTFIRDCSKVNKN